MKKILLASVAASLLSAGVASAADLPRRTAPSVPARVAPAFSWTGFYVGANAGYSFENEFQFNNTVSVGTLAIPSFTEAYSEKSDGFTGGGQIGYNYQFNQFVAGIEADINYIDAKNRFGTTTISSGIAFDSALSTEIRYLGTVRGRLGYAFDRFLVYATGGLAYGEVKLASTFSAPAAGLGWSGSRSKTETGYAVGGGVEYAFTNNLSARIEYLYYDLGKTKFTAVATNAATAATGSFNAYSVETTGNIVRAGINYKF